jgi:hypothetical protein
MVDELLERFPEPVTLYASPGKWLTILAGCALFVGVGVFMITSPAFFRRSYLGVPADIVGWFDIVFFGLGVIVCVVALMPGRSHLTLDANGFTVHSLFRSSTARWEDVDDFAAVNMAVVHPTRKIMLVGYNDRTQAQRSLARANMGLVGRNSALPDTYGMTAADLAHVMLLWRRKALS